MAAEAAIVGPPACDSFTGSSSTVTINIAAAYNAIEVSFALFNGLAPTGVTNNSGNETYTVTAYNGATPIASQTLSLLGDPFSGIATGSYGLVDLVAPAGQTMTRVTITPALSYGANIWNYLIDSIAFNQSVQNALGAGADTDTTTLTLSPNPATIGQNVTASVSVAATAGATVPTGNVVISGGGATCTATLSQSRGITATGTALGSCTLVFATPGDYTVTADYAGDAAFAPSSGTADIEVLANADATTLTLSPNPATIGQNVTASVTVAAATPGAGTPSGNVAISSGGASCTATLSATGSGSCTLVFATPGDYTVTADYAGDASFSPSSGTADIEVLANADTTTLSLSPNPATIGQNVTASVTVAAATSGAGTPSGNVAISSGGVSCTATLNATGSGSCTLVFATPGDYTVTADYAGDASFAPSSGTADIKVVGLVPVITTAPGARAGGAVNAPYTLGLTATNSPTQWDITAGQLPPGLTMNPASGAISGTPNAAGSYDFTVTASNAAGASAPVSFTISIAAAGAPSATPVPTLGETALALLAALLGVSAAFTRGRGRGR